MQAPVTLNQFINEEAEILLSIYPDFKWKLFQATVDISIFIDTYPTSAPKIKVRSTMGLADEGRDLANSVADYTIQYFHRNNNYESILCSIVDFIYDQLDLKNNGECLLCYESLVNNSAKSTSEEYSFRTVECLHSFHVHCIVKWASIVYENQFHKRNSSSGIDVDAIEVRSMEGQIKYYQQEIQILSESIEMNEKEIEHLANKFQQNELLSQAYIISVNDKITRLRKQLAAILSRDQNYHPAIGKSSETDTKSSTKIKLSSKAHLKKDTSNMKVENSAQPSVENLQNEILSQERELLRAEKYLLTLGGVSSEEVAKNIRSAIENCSSNIKCAKEKRERANQSLKQSIAEFSNAQSKLTAKQNDIMYFGFPCPYCRQQLFANSCLPSNPKYFNNLLMHQINASASSLIQNTEKCSSNVSSLETSLLSVVREIQSYQHATYAKLKCKPPCTFEPK